MIKISHHNNAITVSGHAGYAEPGKDIVCASISTLLQGFASVDEFHRRIKMRNSARKRRYFI